MVKKMASSVKVWLETLLLDQYLVSLEEAGYDTLEKCASLTDDELDRIGITVPGYKKRILTHLPPETPQKVVATRPAPQPPSGVSLHDDTDQIYDIPPVLSRSQSRTSDSEQVVYENFKDTLQGNNTIPDLPPKNKQHRRSNIELLDPMSPTEISPPATVQHTAPQPAGPPTRPVPKPRPSLNKKQKPKPKPRPSVVKHHEPGSNPVTDMGAIYEETDSSVQSNKPITSCSAEDLTTESSPSVTPHVLKRKLSLPIAGATVTETETECETIAITDTRTQISEEKSDILIQAPNSTAVEIPKVPPPLTVDEIEYFEKLDSIPDDKSDSKALKDTVADKKESFPVVETEVEKTLPVMDPNKRERFSSDFDDPIYNKSPFYTSPSIDELDSLPIYDTQASFDLSTPIPSNIDEWDKATDRKSLMVGAQLPTEDELQRLESYRSLQMKPQMQPAIPEDISEASTPETESDLPVYNIAADVNKEAYALISSNSSGKQSGSNCKPPGPEANRVNHFNSAELGNEIYDTPVDVNSNVFAVQCEKSDAAARDMESEEDDNTRNEILYAEAQLRQNAGKITQQQPRTSDDPVYMGIWTMNSKPPNALQEKHLTEDTSGSHQSSGQTSPFDMPPPLFAPPPLPQPADVFPQSLKKPEVPPPPPRHLPESPKSTADTKPRQPISDSKPLTRPLPSLPPSSKSSEGSGKESHAHSRAAMPLPEVSPINQPAPLPGVSSHSRAAMPLPGMPPVLSPNNQSASTTGVSSPSCSPSIPARPKIPTRTGSHVTSPPTRPAPALPVQAEKPPLAKMNTAGTRDSFTDLALDRVSSTAASDRMPQIEEQSLSESSPTMPPGGNKPLPPPRVENLFRSPDPERGLYSLQGPVSPVSYEDYQSDDTLSDGGEWLDSFNFQRPSIEVLKEAVRIIPAVQSKTADKSGYLYKRASQDALRRMSSRGWIKRWITLDGEYLKYYSSKKHLVSKRVIPVATMLNVEPDIKTSDMNAYQFKLTTVDRIYTFAAESADEMTMWTNMLMLAIIEMKAEEFDEGGEMSFPDKQGFLKVEGIKNRRFFVLKKDKLAYYNTQRDFGAGTPISYIEMKLASVKDLGKQRMEIITPTYSKILVMDSDGELHDWKAALEQSIAEALGDDSVLNEVYENHSNRFCADCKGSGPHWASINLGVTLCKQCAGIHRMLTFPLSKIRSLRMDFRVWKPSLIQMMQEIGNDNANLFWEWHIQDTDRIDTDADMVSREHFIMWKYRNKRFCRLHPLNGDQKALNEALQKSVQYGDVLETMQLFFTGANILSKGPDGRSPLQLAQDSSQSLQVIFLYQNGAEGSGNMPITTSMVLDHMVMAGGCLTISHKGYLHKTGSNRAEFLKRWCVLERGALTYFETEKSSQPRGKISRVDMLSIALATDARFEFAFEISTSKHGRTYLFSADNEEDRRQWVNLIAKSMAPVTQEVANIIRDFDRAGIVYMKKGANGEWNKCWLQWKGQTLSYFCKGMNGMDKMDLRKVNSMTVIALSPGTCKEAFEDGHMFTINVYRSTFYIQGDSVRETDSWFKIISKMSKESGKRLGEQPLAWDDSPVLVDKCINFVALHGMNQQGIYRLNGQHSKITKLLEDFHKDARDVTLKLEDNTIHDVATALKRFFRSLDDPLLTEELYPRWINTAAIPDVGVKVQWYQYLIKELPLVNYATLKKIVVHLAAVADNEMENKMSSTNLASIFGPVVMRLDKDGDDGAGYSTTSQEIAIFKDMLDHHLNLFEVTEKEKEAEKKMSEAIARFQNLQESPVKDRLDEMLLPVYIISKERQCITIKVTSSMTAHDLLQQLKPKAKLQQDKHYAIHEVICSEELERPLHDQEKVLEVILQWSPWPQDLCKDNMLCVKENYLYDNIELVFDPHSSLFGELKYSEKKNFRKYCFEFSQMKMSYKKDSRATAYVHSWNIEDLTVYLGVQQRRNPPSPWGFSFIRTSDKVHSPYFGHSVCCNTKEELYRWMAAILHVQNPSGLRSGARTQPDGAACQAEVSNTSYREYPSPPSVFGTASEAAGALPTSSPSSRHKSFKASIARLMRR